MIRFDPAMLKHTNRLLSAENSNQADQFATVLAASEAPEQALPIPDNKEKIAAHNAAVLAMVSPAPDAREEFLAFMEKTPMERMREQILRVLGLTEEEVEAMTPEKRQAVEDQIAAMIKENARQNLEAQAEGSSQQRHDERLNL